MAIEPYRLDDLYIQLSERDVEIEQSSPVLRRLLRENSEEGVIVELLVEEQSAIKVGNLIDDFDREMRRTVSVLREFQQLESVYAIESDESDTGHVRQRELPGPIRTATGQLLLKEVRPGSLHLVFAAVNAVQAVLLSQPLQSIITLQWLWDRMPRRRGAIHAEQLRSTPDLIQGLIEAVPSMVHSGHEVRIKLSVDSAGSLELDFHAN